MAGSTLTKGVWADQCRRLGWASKLEPGLLDWNFFCARMRFRWKLRRKLRQYCSFLDVRSFSAVRPGASVICLQTIESKIGRPLPWSMFELWRWADGQDARDRGGVQFLNGARLLSSSEALELGGYCLDARPLIPFTDEIRGRKRYCMDLDGKVWLCSGFNTLHVADSLYELLHRSLI